MRNRERVIELSQYSNTVPWWQNALRLVYKSGSSRICLTYFQGLSTTVAEHLLASFRTHIPGKNSSILRRKLHERNFRISLLWCTMYCVLLDTAAIPHIPMPLSWDGTVGVVRGVMKWWQQGGIVHHEVGVRVSKIGCGCLEAIVGNVEEMVLKSFTPCQRQHGMSMTPW